MTTPNTRILIVEDEPVVKLYLKSCLEQMGYQVLPPASSYQEAISAFKSEIPHLVLMDIVLDGELDGIQAAETIYRDYKVPVVFLTAYSDDDTLNRARLCQPYGYIVKPFKEEDLKSTIEVALFKAKQETQLRNNLDFSTSLLDSIEYPVVAVGLNEEIIYLNSRVAECAGKPERDLMGKGFGESFPLFSENGEPREIPFGRIMVSGIAELYEGITLKSAQGEERLIDAVISPFRNLSDKVIGSVILFRDVTEISLSREEKLKNLQYLTQLLEKQNRD